VTGTLVVFAKWPEPGAVKTRLCPPLTPEQAAAFYDAMLGDVLDATAREAPRRGLALALAVTPAERARDFSARAPAYRVFAQQGADLSQRGGAQRVLLRGSDSPALAPEVLDAALAALARVDVALSPDRDGGYNLVALRRFAPGLFAHAMSTSTVLDDTRTAAARLGLASEVLAPGFDIDTAADFAPLREARPRASALCPRTYAWLDAHAELTRA